MKYSKQQQCYCSFLIFFSFFVEREFWKYQQKTSLVEQFAHWPYLKQQQQTNKKELSEASLQVKLWQQFQKCKSF